MDDHDHDYDVDKTSQLTADLQKAALNLIKHLGTNNFRMRIEGSSPALYITLSEGRSSYSADSVVFHAPQAGAGALAPNTALNAAPHAAPDPAQIATQDGVEQASLLAYFSKLRKVLAA